MLPELKSIETQSVLGIPFRLGHLDKEDRQNICTRLAACEKVGFEKALVLVDDLVMFLSASVAFPDALFSPPEMLDRVWHEFIIHTKAYTAFCASLGVFYIHHNPSDAEAVAQKGKFKKSLREILDQHRVSYDKSIWSQDANDCYGCDKSIQIEQIPVAKSNLGLIHAPMA